MTTSDSELRGRAAALGKIICDTYIGRQALRDALFATKGFDGMGGEITCNEHGDCAGFKFAAYKFVDADPESFEIGRNPVKIHP